MQLALLTGGSRGLGAALYHQLEAAGWQLLEFSRSAPHPRSVPIDLADPQASSQTLADALAALPATGLQALLVINNAGTLAPMGPAAQQRGPALLASLHTNLATPILLLAQVVSHFQHADCRKVIVNISSGAAHKVYAGWSLYGTAKAGMEQFIRTLAEEQRHQAHPFVAVNVYPGVIDTEMQATIRRADPRDFPDQPRFVQRQAQGELRPPERVAAAVLRIAALPHLAGGERYDVAQHGA